MLKINILCPLKNINKRCKCFFFIADETFQVEKDFESCVFSSYQISCTKYSVLNTFYSLLNTFFMEIQRANKTALVFGSTGMVGGFVLQFLLASKAYSKVVAFTRGPLSISDSKLQNVVIDFEKLDTYKDLIKGHDLFLCLGTTIKKAGSQEAFMRVDFDYPYQIASIAKSNGVSQLLLCSAVDADANSKIFYNRVKGKLEDEVKKMHFWAVHIFQPSLLLGERNESRFGEKIAIVLSRGLDKIMGGLLSKYRPVEGEIVARAMVSAAAQVGEKATGIHVYPSHELSKII